MPSNTHSLDLELSSSQYAYCADNADVSITGDITIECWIKLEQLSSTVGKTFGIVSHSDAFNNDRGYALFIPTTNKMRIVWTDTGEGTGHWSIFNCDTAFVAEDVGVWKHIAVAVDVSVPSVEFYINGALQNDTAISTLSTSIHDSDAPFVVGSGWYTGTPDNTFFDGLIDDVRLWSDIRTSTEISDNYQQELTGSEGNLNGYWKLNNDYTDVLGVSNLTDINSPVFSEDVPFVGAAGPTGVKTVNDLAVASVKTINDTAIASIKTINDAS